MNDVFPEIKERFKKFWYDIYNIEKEEIRKLKAYIDYSKEKLINLKITSNDYDSVKHLFIRKHFAYLEEAYSCILLGNYNSAACLLRIIIENYVSFYYIKKFKKEKIYNDWYLWSSYKIIRLLTGTEYEENITKNYDNLKKHFNLETVKFSNQAYSWLDRVLQKKNYSFKEISKDVDPNIYKDFQYFSDLIHNNDYYTKGLTFFDQTKLTTFIYDLYFYTDKLIELYDKRYLRDKTYNQIVCNLLETLDKCNNVKL